MKVYNSSQYSDIEENSDRGIPISEFLVESFMNKLSELQSQ